MSAAREERGQVLVLSVLFMSTLLGMAALVLDVGSWFRADRALQGAADAAALAGASALPADAAEAQRLAVEYADANGGGVAPADVSVVSSVRPNDEISVRAHRDAPGFFSRVLGIVSVRLGATASARAETIGSPRWVAPIAVNEAHPALQCKPTPCFGDPTQVVLAKLHGIGSGDESGAFGLVDLSRQLSGSIGSSTLADWIRDGYGQYLSTGWYGSAPGADFNSSQVQAALNARVGSEMLFPVYRTLTGSGATARFEIVGWAGFTLTSWSGGGSSGVLYGSFTRVTWDGIESHDPTQPDFGATTVRLVR